MREFIQIVNVPDEAPLVETVETDNQIYISESNGAYVAEWDDMPSKNDLRTLFETIRTGDDYEAYRLNSMVFLNKRKALIAINSLAKQHPSNT